MNLYYVAHFDEAENNRDALIEAESPADALTIWRQEFEMELEDIPSIRQVKLTGSTHMIPWADLLATDLWPENRT